MERKRAPIKNFSPMSDVLCLIRRDVRPDLIFQTVCAPIDTIQFTD
jgi:hypothetical protein